MTLGVYFCILGTSEGGDILLLLDLAAIEALDSAYFGGKCVSFLVYLWIILGDLGSSIFYRLCLIYYGLITSAFLTTLAGDLLGSLIISKWGLIF